MDAAKIQRQQAAAVEAEQLRASYLALKQDVTNLGRVLKADEEAMLGRFTAMCALSYAGQQLRLPEGHFLLPRWHAYLTWNRNTNPAQIDGEVRRAAGERPASKTRPDNYPGQVRYWRPLVTKLHEVQCWLAQRQIMMIQACGHHNVLCRQYFGAEDLQWTPEPNVGPCTDAIAVYTPPGFSWAT